MNTLQSLNWTNTTDDWFVTAGKDKYATVWDANTGKQVLKLEGHSSSIQAAIFSFDDKKVFTVGIDQNLIIWEVNLKEKSKSELSRIRTKHCVDMALKANSLVSINKTQAHCYFFSTHQQQNKSKSDESISWQPNSKNADLPEDSDMANEDYLEGDGDRAGD